MENFDCKYIGIVFREPNFAPMNRCSISQKDRGFALVVTLALMMLLALIAVGLLSLGTISSRSVVTARAMATARSNARLALILAIGELQKSAGSDQRVTANGDIIQGVANERKHTLGVWSTENWKAGAPTTRTFLGWLDSSLSSSASPDVNAVKTAPAGDAITLVGSNTMGGTSDGLVNVSPVSLTEKGKVNGRYAWWVSDESQKARFDLDDKLARETWTQVKDLRLNNPQRTGIHAMTDMSQYASKAETDAQSGARNISRAVSLKNASLFLGGGAVDQTIAKRYHDLTTVSRSLLTDVRTGGFKRDLSLAFEMPLSEFRALPEFSNSKERNNTPNNYNYAAPLYFGDQSDLGYLFQIPYSGGSTMRGPTWDLLGASENLVG